VKAKALPISLAKVPRLQRTSVGSVAVMLACPLHVSKVSQNKEKGKTKQATLESDFHANRSESSLWPKRLAR